MPRISLNELQEIGPTLGVSEHGLPWKSLLRSGNLWAIILQGLCLRYGVNFFQFWLHTYLVNRHGYTETALLSTAWLYAAGAVANVIGGVFSDALVSKLGLKWARRVVPFVGLVISAVCLMLTVLLGGAGSALALLSVSYFGLAFAQPACVIVCVDVGARFAGAVFGARNTAGFAGAAISSTVFGYMVKGAGSYDTALIPIAGMIAVSAVLCLRIDATEQLFPESESRVLVEGSVQTGLG